MRGILEIPEKEISFTFDNLTINQFRKIDMKSEYEICNTTTERYPIGEMITLITSNMPETLRDEITKVIKQYCGHQI